MMRRGTRFVSDALQFTGTDLGDRAGALTRRIGQGESESEEDSEESDGPDIDEMDLALMSPREKEEYLVQSAMARIQRARERGSTDVNLSQLELDALERRRQREEEEAERAARRKRREQRIAVPLTQLDPVSRKKTSGSKSQMSSRQQSATDLTDAAEHQALPPVGYFPPPAGSRTRQRSGTTSSQRPKTMGYEDQYELQRPSSRHASDSLTRSRSSRYYDDGHVSSSSGSRKDKDLDPFQFQTAGPRAPRSSGAAAASKRHTMPPESPYRTRSGRTRGAAARRTPSSDETSEEGNVASDESTDEYDSGARVKQTTPPGRQAPMIVQESPEPIPEADPEPKKKSTSPAKRKPVASRVRRSKKK